MRNPTPRPAAAPAGMRGATRMNDPSEAAHDRIRRWLMNLAGLLILLVVGAHWRVVGVHGGREWLTVFLLAVAALPLALAGRVFELRFKLAAAERRQLLRQLPARCHAAYAVYALLAVAVFLLNAAHLAWTLPGVWLYDFLSYYHDRPERMRHLYAVANTLDDLRRFPRPWAWPIPALVWSIARGWL